VDTRSIPVHQNERPRRKWLFELSILNVPIESVEKRTPKAVLEKPCLGLKKSNDLEVQAIHGDLRHKIVETEFASEENDTSPLGQGRRHMIGSQYQSQESSRLTPCAQMLEPFLLPTSRRTGKTGAIMGLVLRWGNPCFELVHSVVLGILALAVSGHQAAAADCEVISATHSADTKGEALQMSRALAAKSADELQRIRGWKHASMSPYKVQPDPFFKRVRPVVPKDVIYASFITAKTYTTCFTGVVVPYVCTSGSKVCGGK
jgi:hypothetical protein